MSKRQIFRRDFHRGNKTSRSSKLQPKRVHFAAISINYTMTLLNDFLSRFLKNLCCCLSTLKIPIENSTMKLFHESLKVSLSDGGSPIQRKISPAMLERVIFFSIAHSIFEASNHSLYFSISQSLSSLFGLQSKLKRVLIFIKFY